MKKRGILSSHGRTTLVWAAVLGILGCMKNRSEVFAQTISERAPHADLSFPVKEWGVYTGWNEGDLRALETKVGKPAQYRAVFVHWGNKKDFPFNLTNDLKKAGKTLLIFWEAMDYSAKSTDQPDYNFRAILSGRWDGYLTQFAKDAAAYGAPVIIVPFSEMNGNWSPWSGTLHGNSPEQHNAAYRYLRSVFKGATNVKFGWAPNRASVPNTEANAMEQYYPGDAFVDYVGVDGFNTGDPPRTFDQVFGQALGRLKAYRKPIFIFSFACVEGSLKAGWITDALTVQMNRYPALKAWIWFNEKKRHDWTIDSDEASLQAFKAALP